MNHPVKQLPSYKFYRTSFMSVEDANWQAAPYSLRLDHYKHKDGNFWDWLKVSVLNEKREVLCSFFHNYHELIKPIYVKQNNKEFIITSGHYQCVSIYNITDNIFTDYAYPNDEEFNSGRALCPETYDWDGKNLKITGRKWGGPKEIMIIKNANLEHLDVSNPQWEDYYEEGDD